MDGVRIGRIVRSLRHRLGWRQTDVGVRAGVSRSSVSELERGMIGRVQLDTVERICTALEARAQLVVTWRGGELDRLLDADHARLQEWLSGYLAVAGWIVVAEATFSSYGERGSIDILAWHPGLRVVLVVEIKTLIADVQGILRPLNAKTRLAPQLARERRWPSVAVLPCLVIANTRTNRRRVELHPQLFAPFSVRGLAAKRWLRDPSSPMPSGLLLFGPVPPARRGSVRQAGRQRVRLRASAASSGPMGSAATSPPDRA